MYIVKQRFTFVAKWWHVTANHK